MEQNTGRDAESLFYRGAGPLAAMLLGIFLIPLRGVTTASNLSFAFIALTLVVSKVGGRWAAVATALVSALSLNFFLTQPYLHLAIHDQNVSLRGRPLRYRRHPRTAPRPAAGMTSQRPDPDALLRRLAAPESGHADVSRSSSARRRASARPTPCSRPRGPAARRASRS